jgi:hypothetical protein
MQATDYLEWVERFGGWGALLLVVRWLMVRMDRTITAFEGMVRASDAHLEAHSDLHGDLKATQNRIEFILDSRLPRPNGKG